MNVSGIFSGFVCVVLGLPVTASAQPATGVERGAVTIGAFLVRRDSSARLDSTAGRGTDLNLEDRLGLESSMSVARLGGHIWFNQRQRLDLSYLDLSRSATRSISETIVFGDETFDIGTVLETEASLAIVKTDYSFTVFARDKGFLGLSAGLYMARIRLTLRETFLGQFETERVTAPLPLLGLRGELRVTPRIVLSATTQWFAVHTDDFDGRLLEFYVGADYRVGDRMALGYAYNGVGTAIGAHRQNGFNGRLDWGYGGSLLYFKRDFGSRR